METDAHTGRPPPTSANLAYLAAPARPAGFTGISARGAS
jgi:hypothetical protein